jgi:plastocyanin
MINMILRRGIVFILLPAFFMNSCTRPEDHPLQPIKQQISPADTASLQLNTYRPKLYTVEISGMKFHPDTVTVHKGDTVMWKNNDMVVHCVTEQHTNAWSSSKIPAGASWKMEVTSGSDYFCAIHLVMKGRISVR